MWNARCDATTPHADLGRIRALRTVISLALVLTFAGVIGFYSAGEYEARQGDRHHGILWAALSALVSGVVFFVFGGGWLLWLVAQGCLFVGIGVVRMWLEDRSKK